MGSDLRVKQLWRQEPGRIELGLVRGHVTADEAAVPCALHIPSLSYCQRTELRTVLTYVRQSLSYCNFAYSALACLRMGMSGSASLLEHEETPATQYDGMMTPIWAESVVPRSLSAVLLRAFNELCLNQSTPRKQFAPFTSCGPARTGTGNRFGSIRLTLNLGGFGILGKIPRRAPTPIHGLKNTIESAYHSVGSNRFCCGLMTKDEAKVSFPRTAGAILFTLTPVVRPEVAGKRL